MLLLNSNKHRTRTDSTVVRLLNPSTRNLLIAGVVLALGFCGLTQAAPMTAAGLLGKSVVIVYNKALPESKELAEFYAEKRLVPRHQLLGLNLSKEESITRKEFNDEVQRPLLKFLEKNHLLSFKPAANSKDSGELVLIETALRYLVLCYGVPVKIRAEATLVEPEAGSLPELLQENRASVDSELALIPLIHKKRMLTGPFNNPAYAATNTAQLHATNGVIIVARLDGPSATVAKGLVEKAIIAEKDGLWGRAYIDARGITEGSYKQGDEMLKQCANLTQNYGFDTYLDNQPQVFSASFPLSHCAIYAGWYSGNYEGPFAAKRVEFVPGAFAYHLHSSSAYVLRTDHEYWVGPLLARGATATMGCTEEPYLAGTPDLSVFLGRWIYGGFTLGEAALASQAWLSWQIIVVGDPLYRPFGQNGPQLHERLLAEKNSKADWANVLVANRTKLMKTPLEEIRGFLTNQAAYHKSAVMLEKMGDLEFEVGKKLEAVGSYLKALKQGPSPQQCVRLTLGLVPLLNELRREKESYQLLQEMLTTVPDYADFNSIYRQLSELATQLKQPEQAEKWKSLATQAGKL